MAWTTTVEGGPMIITYKGLPVNFDLARNLEVKEVTAHYDNGSETDRFRVFLNEKYIVWTIEIIK